MRNRSIVMARFLISSSSAMVPVELERYVRCPTVEEVGSNCYCPALEEENRGLCIRQCGEDKQAKNS